MTRDEIIRAFEYCRNQPICDSCESCKYGGRLFMTCERLADDILSLLKEQEAVTIKKTKEHGFGVYGGICPKCHNWIQSAHSYCGFCGQAVKWE